SVKSCRSGRAGPVPGSPRPAGSAACRRRTGSLPRAGPVARRRRRRLRQGLRLPAPVPRRPGRSEVLGASCSPSFPERRMVPQMAAPCARRCPGGQRRRWTAASHAQAFRATRRAVIVAGSPHPVCPLSPDPRPAQQRATRAAFFIPGFVIATWAPIVPFAKLRAGLDDAQLGLVLLCLGLGSLVAMPLAGALAARQGCRRVMLAAALLLLVLLPLLAVVSDAWLLGGVLLLLGAAMGAMDCIMNIQAVLVEREAGRPMMSGFHAYYSIGSLAGAVVVTLM